MPWPHGVPRNPPCCSGPSLRVSFSWFESRRGAGSATSGLTLCVTSRPAATNQYTRGRAPICHHRCRRRFSRNRVASGHVWQWPTSEKKFTRRKVAQNFCRLFSSSAVSPAGSVPGGRLAGIFGCGSHAPANGLRRALQGIRPGDLRECTGGREDRLEGHSGGPGEAPGRGGGSGPSHDA